MLDKMKYKTILIMIGVILIVALIIISNTGCPNDYIEVDEECVYVYSLNPKNITLKYLLYEQEDTIIIELDSELDKYLAEKSDMEWYDSSWRDFIWMNLNEEKQQKGLLLLVNKIKNITSNKDDQARIAISLVQYIPYDEYAADNDAVVYRYPYETLYDNLGVCGDRSILLASLLQKLDYGVVILDYQLERHRAVGIACDDKYDYLDTGYCFIETNAPAMITDSFRDYPGDLSLEIYSDDDYIKLGAPSEIHYIHQGSLFNAKEEYQDMTTLYNLETNFIEQERKIVSV